MTAIQKRVRPLLIGVVAALVVCESTQVVLAQPGANIGQFSIPLKDICHVKGQESTTLLGVGFVVGLNGTGGLNSLAEQRAVAAYLAKMGMPIQTPEDVKAYANMAMVTVEVTVPAMGAREGGELDCVVSALGAKSLEGGRLLPTSLRGPSPQEGPGIPYGFARGALRIDGQSFPNTAKITGGCRLEREFMHPFHTDYMVTLVLDEKYVGWDMAQSVAEEVNSIKYFRNDDGDADDARGGQNQNESFFEGGRIARAIDAKNIEIQVPGFLRGAMDDFFAEIFRKEVMLPVFRTPYVVIYERTGFISFSGNVEIMPVVINTRSGVAVNVAGDAGAPFASIEMGAQPSAKLADLLRALNALRVPPTDQIDAIRAIDDAGCLHARLITK